MRKVSGTARPAVWTLPCGLMFAAMLGAISATDRPTAAQIDSERLSPRVPSTAMSASLRVLRLHSVPPTPADTEGAKGAKRRSDQVFSGGAGGCPPGLPQVVRKSG